MRSGTKQLASGRDAAALFKTAIDAVPSGGSLGIGEGTYELAAPYSFALDAGGGNIFYCCIPILDKDMHAYGDGVGKTILKLSPLAEKLIPACGYGHDSWYRAVRSRIFGLLHGGDRL